MPTINLPAQNLIANQWFFSAPTQITAITRNVTVRATDPNNQWFTRPGEVKAWGLQMEGYVGGVWDNVDPWIGWGWWAYAAPVLIPDVKQALIMPQTWVSFGSSFKGNGVTLPLSVGIESTNILANVGQNIRLAVQTSADIRLGTQVVLG